MTKAAAKPARAASPSLTGRLAFIPSRNGREYFADLGQRLTQEKGLGVHVTQREAFDVMVEYARLGEATIRARNGSLNSRHKVA